MNKEKKYYLDLLAVREYVDDLIRYCEQQARILQQKIKQDEEQNKRFNYDHQNHSYYEYYNTGLDISTYDGHIGFSNFEDFASYQNALGSSITELRHVTVKLHLNYRSGKNDALVEHIHNFKIHFEPSASYIESEFGDTDEEYRDVYDTLIKKLEAFPAVRTIFSSEAS